MAVVVVGGSSHKVGKTSVVSGLITAITERRWTAIKISGHYHGATSAERYGRQVTGEQCVAVVEDTSRTGDTDTSRFLIAGARRAYWVRTLPGQLAMAMPHIRQIISDSADVIIESNSVMQFLSPELYLAVVDVGAQNFKNSAKLFFDRASAYLVVGDRKQPGWQAIKEVEGEGRPEFFIHPPQYVTSEVVAFIRQRLAD